MVDWNARKIEAQMAARPKGIQMAIDLGSMLGVDPLAVAGRFGGVMKTGIGAFKVALDEVRRFFPEADWKQLLALSQQLALQRFEASKQRLGLSPEFLESQGIPSFASGGLVNRPTLAMIGERGPEAVVPLNRGGVVTININGPVYGINDLEDKVAEAWLNVYRNGGFQGVVE